MMASQVRRLAELLLPTWSGPTPDVREAARDLVARIDADIRAGNLGSVPSVTLLAELEVRSGSVAVAASHPFWSGSPAEMEARLAPGTRLRVLQHYAGVLTAPVGSQVVVRDARFTDLERFICLAPWPGRDHCAYLWFDLGTGADAVERYLAPVDWPF